MKTYFVCVLTIILVFTGGCSATQAQNQIFGFDENSLGLIVGSTLKYYDYSSRSNSWVEDTDMSFNLPNGYKSVFGFDENSLGVIVGNTLKYYDYSSRSNSWVEDTDMSFTIR